MKISKNIPFEPQNTAMAVLSPYIPGLSGNDLLKVIETYNMDSETTTTSKKSTRTLKPYTRQETAELLGLGVAMPTIDRYMANGTLKRIRYSAHFVRITSESVHNLMEGGAA